jgi:competence protein ComEA
MFPLSKWHAVWLAGAVLVSAIATVALRHRAASPAGPVRITTTAPVRASAAPAGPAPNGAASPARRYPIYVHISGQIARPGLYRLSSGARVMDAVTGAGGATADADLDALNLATPLQDGQKLIVPRYGEPPPSPDTTYIVDSPPPPVATLVRADPPVPPLGDSYAEDYAIPIPVTAAPVSPTASSTVQWAPPTVSSGRSSAPSLGKLKVPGEGVVNINRASSIELQRLPGVGPSTAAKILEYRNAHGSFRTVEELMEVKGIGEKKLAKMAPFVAL